MGKNKIFTEKAKNKHGNKYNYDKVNYLGAKEKVIIVCEKHGEFSQQPTNHLSGNGCPRCVNKNKTTKLFIQESTKIHGNKYNYNKVNYLGNKVKVNIICKIHGEFKQIPTNHLSGNGCPKCVGLNKTTEEFILECNNTHNNKYDYSKVIYVNNHEKVIIICEKHGEFKQRASHHLNGHGCPRCVNKNKTTEEFILECKEVHGDFYDYNKVQYLNCKTKIKIICKKHGEFKQRPSDHLMSKGCPICKESKGERIIREFLNDKDVPYIKQYKFDECKYKRKLPFDFYLVEHNICIEYNGRQHYEPVSYFGGEENFKLIKKRDKIKKEYCEKNNIPLIIIKYDEDILKTLIRCT